MEYKVLMTQIDYVGSQFGRNFEKQNKKFEQDVEELLNQGWVLKDGVSVSAYGGSYILAQALVKN